MTYATAFGLFVLIHAIMIGVLIWIGERQHREHEDFMFEIEKKVPYRVRRRES